MTDPLCLVPSLDPRDTTELRSTLHEAVDRLVDRLETVADGPVWRPMTEETRAEVASTLDLAEGVGPEETWRRLERLILPHGVGNLHPRFMGWVHGAGTGSGLVAGLAEAAINANLGGRNTGAAQVEREVVEWARRLFGFPEGASGILTSGTSMATVIALAAARQLHSDWDMESEGLGARGAAFRLYASSAAHGCVEKAMRLLGFGRRSVEKVPTDAEGRVRVDTLREAIETDRRAGLVPFAVVGSAGTVDMGAVDDLAALADLAEEAGLWFHVDGAFGALLQLSPRLRDRLVGIERADSLAFDFHKWMHVTYDCGCVLIREEAHHRAAFAGRPGYLEGQAEGLAAGEPWYCDYGPELSRGFRALRVWTLLTEQGTEPIARGIERCVDLAAVLAERVDRESELERVAPAPLNIVCFRVRPHDGEDGDALQSRVVAELQLRGIAAPSTTRIDGRRAIRCCILNHRTREHDLDVTVDAILEIARELRAG